jgi:hypothetical protein
MANIVLGQKLVVCVEIKHVLINQEQLKIMLLVKHFLNYVLPMVQVVLQ